METTTFKVWCWKGVHWQVSPRCTAIKTVGEETAPDSGRKIEVLEIVTKNAAQLEAHLEREPSVRAWEKEES